MKHLDWKQLTKRRTLGLAVIALGAVVLFAPLVVGEWIVAILGLALVGAGLLQFVETLRFGYGTASFLSYAAGVVTTLLGFVLFLSPRLALSGLLIAVALFFLVNGAVKILAASHQTGPDRAWSIANGLVMLALGFLIAFYLTTQLGTAALGVALGLRLLVYGWTMFFLPQEGFVPSGAEPDTRLHPDSRLALPPSDAVKEVQDAILTTDPILTGRQIAQSLTLVGLFLAIHIFRTDAHWSFIGLISPVAAVAGDVMLSIVLAVLVVLPLRLLWRRLTRPLERAAWERLERVHDAGEDPSLFERAVRSWLEVRMRFAMEMRAIRLSLNYAFWRVMHFGLPLTATLIAVNSIWGFSWYFNSENWASAVWQEITKERVDAWRKRAAEDVERAAVAGGVAPEKVFAVAPEGVDDSGDFAFVVIGDTGEGDASQLSLHDEIVAVGRDEAVKFLVVSSDVIYPDGKMRDYEAKFYLPFKGFTKPVYAIPGNHDWFDADEGFNANFLDRDSATLAMRARLLEDVKTDVINTDQRFVEMTAEAERLRRYYGVRTGLQRAPFFEMHTPGFSLVAVDTGILRRVDEKERAWLEAALARAGDNFKMVVLGHPFYVAGVYQGAADPAFDDLYRLLERYGVDVAMAGDTHDFEFYRVPGPRKPMLNFVNGGGGAYLSVGTSLGFSHEPATSDYAFYPRTDQLTAKIRDEAPLWKTPFLLWMKFLHGYPFDNETVSGAFDFNRAPFFQSFLEVRVERSQRRVRFVLHGATGPLRWRDVQAAGGVKPADKTDDDVVEFVAPDLTNPTNP